MANPSQPRGERGRFVTASAHAEREQAGNVADRRGQLAERLPADVREALQRHVNDRAG